MLSFGITLIGIGCTEPAKPTDTGGDKPKPTVAEVKPKPVDNHDGWWCDEHGLPEDECWKCSKAYAKKCKDVGDWCEKHKRPESQCFICKPELKAEWAKKHVTKLGKEPPAFEDY